MREGWLPFSAAALASGAVALVLGALGLPSTPDGYALLENAQLHDGRWIMSAAAYFIGSVGLTLGLPTFVYVLPARGRVLGILGTGVFAIASMGMAAYAALLIFFRTLVQAGVIGQAEVALLVEDRALLTFAAVFLLSFYLGELLLAIGLLRARTVPRWVPALFGLHVLLLPFNALLPQLQGVQTVVIGVAFVGVAVFANERAQSRAVPNDR